ncbi:hypothetical protein PHYSODRAFT_252346 [Phytophthora sojae]|uniref:Uncharacterized protein n=1 Tax=Phytophthora sojae (strain P6497) TaxID=1094619 RepID=G5A6P6_PHYSP|nr:hypothetical protein PHYSODRAFT_252346 [Phytophthora sojae]EGZ09001.1 hypothetical protein PHYSODRAFT_252346 [Phytophthora sojae]|eukprot:XP_009535634.1 hypothetical protein PHYSODRAFT_252346 [Phytophthora sojae]
MTATSTPSEPSGPSARATSGSPWRSPSTCRGAGKPRPRYCQLVTCVARGFFESGQPVERPSQTVAAIHKASPRLASVMVKKTNFDVTDFDNQVDSLDMALELDDEGNVFIAQREFWARLRTRLSVNNASQGLDVLDAMAMDVLSGGDARRLNQILVILPHPDQMQAGEPAEHSVLSIPMPPLVPTPESTSPPPRPSTGTRSSPRTSSKTRPPSKKKQKAAAKKKAEAYDFRLPTTAPARLKIDLAALTQRAFSKGLAPFRLAYPWRKQRCWYPPSEYPELHLVHYRANMRFHELFFPVGARRKEKMNACRARNELISYNIEERGYFGFLDDFENDAHDTLMWLGGRAAKHSAGAAKSKGAAHEDLGVVFAMDKILYERAIERALDPKIVDEHGYASTPELLEEAELIDPTRAPHLRLSDKALARIKLDVTSGPPSVPSWVGNRTRGPCKALLSDASLKDTIEEVVELLVLGMKVAVYDQKPFNPDEQGDDDSDFEDEDGAFTALPPTPPVQYRAPAVKQRATTPSKPGVPVSRSSKSGESEDSSDDKKKPAAIDDSDKDDKAQPKTTKAPVAAKETLPGDEADDDGEVASEPPTKELKSRSASVPRPSESCAHLGSPFIFFISL